jgi:hypothetical protein
LKVVLGSVHCLTMGKPYRFHKTGDDLLLCLHQLIPELRKQSTCFLSHHSGADLDA